MEVEATVTKVCPYCKEEIKVDAVKCKHCGEFIYKDSCQIVEQSTKSYVGTLILCAFLGSLGIHRFYVGKIGTGILMLITFGGFGIWALIDFIIVACCHFKDKKGRDIKP